MIQDFIALLARLCYIDEATLSTDTRLSQLDLDSMNLIEISAHVEKNFAAHIDDHELLELDHVAAIVSLISERQTAGPQTPGLG